jgi:hypothetical protein
MGRRRGGSPDDGDGTERRRARDATTLQLAVLRRVDRQSRRQCRAAAAVVNGVGDGAGRRRRDRGRCRTLALGQAVSEDPANAGQAPKFGRSSLSDIDFGARLESFFFAQALKFGPHSGAQLELL